ncbi:MAG: ubiquinol-cytochrome c reductase iron-sulfur subunit [Actinomycetota bacterium]
MRIGRRKFLANTWKALVGILGMEAVWTTRDFLRPRASKGFGAPIRIGSPSKFREGSVRHFSNGRFYVTRVDGELRAVYQKCPHLGCRIPFCESSNQFECPCHGSVFNRKGEYVRGPAPRGMDSFPVREEGDDVIVDTGRVITGPPRGVRTLNENPGPSCLTQGESGESRAGEQ